MASLRKNASISNVRRFKLVNSTTGSGFTGATNGSSGLTISTICDVEATAVAYTQAGATIQTIATLGTFAAPSANNCRFKEVDATNHPGLCEFQFADARYAVANAKQMVVTVSGVTNLLQADYEIQLTSTDVDDAVHGGLSALPNTPVTTNGSLITSGTATAQLNPTSGGVDLQTILTHAATVDANNVLNVSAKYVNGTLQTAGDIYGYLTTNIGALGANLTATATAVWAVATRVLTAGTNIVLGKGTGITGLNDITAAQAATGIWQDATAGDFTVAGSIGKSVFTAGNIPGASGGLSIVGCQQDLVNAPNATAVTAFQLGISKPGTAQTIDFTTALPTNPGANTLGEALFFADILGGRINTAQAGAATTITLDASASSDTGAYIGDDIYLYGGTGGGIRGTGQRRTVTAYNTSTKVATINRAWDTTPDATTKFMTLPQPLAFLAATDATVATVATNLNATISSRSTYAGGAADAEAAAIKTKTDLIATNSADSPNAVTAQNAIATNLNATISSRSTVTDASVATDVQTGLTAQGYTTARAPKLDDLDAAVSSRSTYSGGVADANAAAMLTILNAFNVSGITLTTAQQAYLLNASNFGGIFAAPVLSLAPSGGGGGGTVIVSWAQSLSASGLPQPTAGTIGWIVGDYASFTITNLGTLTGRTKLYLTIKNAPNQAYYEALADSASEIQIEETAGLLYVHGSPASNASCGSLAVTDATVGTININIHTMATKFNKASDNANRYLYAVRKEINSGNGDSLTIGVGRCAISPTITQAT
jgi:hypothetical protein